MNSVEADTLKKKVGDWADYNVTPGIKLVVKHGTYPLLKKLT